MWTECTKDLLDVKVKKLSRQQLKAGKEMTIWKEVCGQKLHYATIENTSSVRNKYITKMKSFKHRVQLSLG